MACNLVIWCSKLIKNTAIFFLVIYFTLAYTVYVFVFIVVLIPCLQVVVMSANLIFCIL